MGDIRITEEEMRQALNDRHTEGVQSRISAARVAVAGLGGLGSNIAVSLARIGVGRLHLIDFDRVDVTNLNRQQYFADQVGMYKTEALRENLLRINPWLELRTDCLRVTEENAAALLRDDMYICEAFDDAGNKAMLVREVLEKLPGTYLVAASGMAGYGRSTQGGFPPAFTCAGMRLPRRPPDGGSWHPGWPCVQHTRPTWCCGSYWVSGKGLYGLCRKRQRGRRRPPEGRRERRKNGDTYR